VAGGERRGLGDAHQFEGEVAVGFLGLAVGHEPTVVPPLVTTDTLGPWPDRALRDASHSVI
jgi:hypothetical protein